ncbi:MAG: type II toxin-antitoxin system HicA family toxin [Kiloniellaceae bacterium]
MRTWTFNEFIRLLEKHGFALERQTGSSRIYKGAIGGKVRLVSVHFHRGSDDIRRGTPQSMIRQSGLPKKLFRQPTATGLRGTRHRKVMVAAVPVIAGEQRAQGMAQEPEPQR